MKIKYADILGEELIKRRETIAVAESVTSGALQAALSQAENAARFYEGGITTYNLPQKVKHFDVDFAHGVQCNCVSGEIAVDMAAGCIKLFESNWGIGITGYASPVPELDINELYAYYAIVHNENVVKTGLLRSGKKSAVDAQEDYTGQILRLASEVVKTGISVKSNNEQ